MSRPAAELAVNKLFHECGLRTWQDTHRRYLVRRSLLALVLVVSALILGVALAWIAPSLLHAIHQTQNGASLLRQSISKVGD